MNWIDIKRKAKEMGINAGRMKKAELIKAIQNKEGNNPCFGNENRMNCDQVNCCWRDDCLK